MLGRGGRREGGREGGREEWAQLAQERAGEGSGPPFSVLPLCLGSSAAVQCGVVYYLSD